MIPKQHSRRESSRAHHNHLGCLVQSLGTPDGLRAFSELAINTAIATAIIFLLLSNDFSEATFFRIAAALALGQLLFRVHNRRQN
jgi:hypothetical protein